MSGVTLLLNPDDPIDPAELRSTLDTPEMRANRAIIAAVLDAKVETYDWLEDVIAWCTTTVPHPSPCGPGAVPDRALALDLRLPVRMFAGPTGVPSC